MARTYNLSNDDSDLTGGADFDKDLIENDPGSATALTMSAGALSTTASRGYTESGEPNIATWGSLSSWTVSVDVSTSDKDVDIDIDLYRVTSSGTGVDGPHSSTEGWTVSTTTSPIVFTFSGTWGGSTATDRLRVVFQIQNNNEHSTKTIDIDTIDTTVYAASFAAAAQNATTNSATETYTANQISGDPQSVSRVANSGLETYTAYQATATAINNSTALFAQTVYTAYQVSAAPQPVSRTATSASEVYSALSLLGNLVEAGPRYELIRARGRYRILFPAPKDTAAAGNDRTANSASVTYTAYQASAAPQPVGRTTNSAQETYAAQQTSGAPQPVSRTLASSTVTYTAYQASAAPQPVGRTATTAVETYAAYQASAAPQPVGRTLTSALASYTALQATGQIPEAPNPYESLRYELIRARGRYRLIFPAPKGIADQNRTTNYAQATYTAYQVSASPQPVSRVANSASATYTAYQLATQYANFETTSSASVTYTAHQVTGLLAGVSTGITNTAQVTYTAYKPSASLGIQEIQRFPVFRPSAQFFVFFGSPHEAVSDNSRVTQVAQVTYTAYQVTAVPQPVSRTTNAISTTYTAYQLTAEYAHFDTTSSAQVTYTAYQVAGSPSGAVTRTANSASQVYTAQSPTAFQGFDANLNSASLVYTAYQITGAPVSVTGDLNSATDTYTAYQVAVSASGTINAICETATYTYAALQATIPLFPEYSDAIRDMAVTETIEEMMTVIENLPRDSKVRADNAAVMEVN